MRERWRKGECRIFDSILNACFLNKWYEKNKKKKIKGMKQYGKALNMSNMSGAYVNFFYIFTLLGCFLFASETFYNKFF